MTQEGGKQDDDRKAEAENGNAGDSAPEVEAEVVADGAETSTGEHAFDPADEEVAPEIEEALAGAEAAMGPRKSTLTPGVMLFLAFAAIALIAVAVWRLQTGGADRSPSPENAPAAQETSSHEPPSQEPPSQELSAEEPPAFPAPEGRSEDAEPAPEEKIINLSADDLQPSEPSDAPADSFLPPVSAGGAEKIANSVEAGAKEAMRRLREESAGEASEADLRKPGQNDLQADENGDVEAASDEAGIEALEDETPAVTPDEPSADATVQEPTDEAMLPAGAPVSPDAGNGNIADETLPGDKIMNDQFAGELDALRGETTRLEGALADERARNAALAAEIAVLRKNFETALAARERQYEGELSSMRASIEKIQNSGIRNASDRLKAPLAVEALRRKVDAGAPFENELRAVAAFAPDDAAALAPYARAGAPTDAALRETFGAAARAGLAAAGQAQAGDNWGAQLLARAQSLVSVRPAQPISGDGARAIISRAEQGLHDGDAAVAFSELERLPAPAQAAMSDWMAAAHARAEASAALNRLSARFSTGGAG